MSLDSDVPVTAGVLTRVTGLTDVAYTAAGRPMTPATPGAVAEARQGEGVTSSLLLAAPGPDATVRLAPVPPATGTPTEVRVPGASQVVVDLATVSTAASFSLTISPLPGSGPVLAVRAVSEAGERGPLLTTELVDPGRYTVTVPAGRRRPVDRPAAARLAQPGGSSSRSGSTTSGGRPSRSATASTTTSCTRSSRAGCVLARDSTGRR